MPSKLMTIIQEKDVMALKELLSQGESPNGIDETVGESYLAVAAARGDSQTVQTLLDYDADPNFLETCAWPLANAAGQGHTDIVQVLLDAGAEVDSLDEDGGTALIDASSGGYLEIVEMLLEAGADPRHKDRYGKRAIIYAAENGCRLIVAMLSPLSTTRDRQQAEFMLKLAEQGPPSDDVLAFHKAAEKGDIQAIQDYLDAGGVVDAIDEEGWTAFFKAAHRGHLNVLKLLVAYKANVNHIDRVGSYALVYVRQGKQNPVYEYVYSLTSKELRKDWERRENKARKIAKERGYL